MKGDLADTFTPQTLNFVTAVDEEGHVKEQITFPEEQTRKLFFDTFKGHTISERINKIAWQYAMVFTTSRHYNKEQNKGLKERFVKLLYNFLPINDIDKVFEIFLTRMGLKTPKSERVAYMDKGALMLIKYYLYGFKHDFSAKYLIIDEMQDFTPVDLYMFKKIWNCPSILLGDKNQCIEKCLPDNYMKTVAEMWGGEFTELKKTYRSTKQIANFAYDMLGLKDIEYVNRDGDKPKLINTKDDNIANAIIDIIESDCGEYEHIAVICKCKKEAKIRI